MSNNLLFQHPYIILALVALLVNVPFGYIRQNCPKFSLKWLFWIHASIPIIIYLRIVLETSKLFIPVTIFFVVIGQVYGSLWRKKYMTLKDEEAQAQIPTIDRNENKNITDSQVMVALLNMGGPKTNNEVRDFQRRLFLDSRLIRFPMSWALQKVFASLLIAFRTKKTQKRYQLIGGGSPQFDSTQNQVKAVQDELNRRGRALKVTLSFNYSLPLPEDTINEIKAAKKNYLLPVSLYPHYSKATTGSNIHYLNKAAKELYPELQFLTSPSYHLHESYIRAFTDRILQQVQPSESLNDFYLLFSAHGLPLYFLKEGDPYPFQISQTVACVVTELKRNDQWAISYQSAVGPLQWMKPSTDDMIKALARRMIKKLIIVPISFVTDHIETTCEIDIEYRQMAENLGISDFRMSKALECHPGFITALADTVERSLLSGIKNQEKLLQKKYPGADRHIVQDHDIKLPC